MQELTGARHDTRRVLHETDVDGVRTFFVPTGQTPFACLSFRVGLADETLVTHGWTHLLEHLAMHELDNPRIQANASVDLCTTDFYVSGDADDVVDFMRSLCRWLSEPDFAALDHERDVLEAESRSRNAGHTGQHLDYRYGPNGVGLASYRELGLRTADPDRLRSWAHRGFTAQNASLAMNCAPLRGMRLELPHGVLHPLPQTPGLLPVPSPAHAAGAGADTAVSGLVTDSLLSTVVASVLSQEISRALRHERAVSYGTTATVSRVDADHVMILLATDIVPAEHSHSVDLVTRVVRSLLASGEPTRILNARDQLVRHMRDDPIALWQATSASTAVLRGSQPHDEREALQRLGEVSAADLMGQIEQFWSSALITSPAGAQSVTDIPFTTGTPDVLPAPDALEFVSRSAPADASRAHLGEQTLTFSDTGRDGVPQRRGVELDDAAALLVFPDGARQVVSRHGTTLHVEPNRWRDGDELVRRLERLVPTERWVPMGEREPTSVPSAGSRWSWLTTQLVHFLARRRVASMLVALLVVVGIQLAERVYFSAPEERMSTVLLESTVDSFYTRYFRTDVTVDCHGASPKIGEAVSCTLVWGPMRRTAVRAVVPFRWKGNLGLEYLSGETLTRQVPAPAGPLAPLAPLASPTEGPASPSPLHG